MNDRRRLPSYQLIADALRQQIVNGEIQPGTQLPSTEELGTKWNASYFTIHTALKLLVKQGHLERIHGSGTFVAEPQKSFTGVGLYYGANIWENDNALFSRNLHLALVEQLERMGKSTTVFVDSRPERDQGSPLPDLLHAIHNRDIQCLIVGSANSTAFPGLDKLPIPVSFSSGAEISKRFFFDRRGLIQEGIRRLAAKGCRSIGFICNICDAKNPIYLDFFREIERAGLTTQKKWIRRPPEFTRELARYGYTEFLKIWAMRERPEGLIVYPDVAVIGVIAAALKSGATSTEQMTFFFHRNAKVKLICPMPAIWGIGDEGLAADALIELIVRQMNGEKVSPIMVPYQFEETTGAFIG